MQNDTTNGNLEKESNASRREVEIRKNAGITTYFLPRLQSSLHRTFSDLSRHRRIEK